MFKTNVFDYSQSSSESQKIKKLCFVFKKGLVVLHI